MISRAPDSDVRSAYSNIRERVVSLLLTIAAVAVAFLLLVELKRYFALMFCGVLMATALSGVARTLARGKVPHAPAVAIVLVCLLAVQVGFVAWTGPELVEQFDALKREVPRGFNAARDWLESTEIGGAVLADAPKTSELAPDAERVLADMQSALGAGLSVATGVLVVLAIGIFIAVSPGRYVDGAVRLVPAPSRPRAHAVFEAMGRALRRWLLARALLMVVVAVLIGIGLLVIGIDLALPLALVAGLFSFIPYVGPALALLPMAGMGLLKSPMHALYVVILYLAVQFIESYVVTPLVEGKAMSLAPALLIAGQVLAAAWLGAVGILIASPLLVVITVAVQMLYLEGVLGEDVSVIGTDESQ